MRRRFWTVVLAAGIGVASGGIAPASDEIAEKEGVACTSCHVKQGSKKLSDRGLYYQAIGSLDGYEQLAASFGSCGHCHARKPGSTKLTRAGRRFAEFVGDMKELHEWLQKMHPPFSEAASAGGGHGDRLSGR